MPKKFTGENSKAVAAKERKNEKAAVEKAAKLRRRKTHTGPTMTGIWPKSRLRRRIRSGSGWRLWPRRKSGRI
jgi:hypothetical protein